MIKTNYIENVYNEYLDLISSLTGFKTNEIEIIESKRNNNHIPNINHHTFIYQNKTYTLIDKELNQID